MNRVLAVLAFFAFGLGTALAASDIDAPVHWRGHGQEVIMHSSMKPINVVAGDNPVDKLWTFTCKSIKGCVVITSAALRYSIDTGKLGACTFIDGTAAAPGCGYGQFEPSSLIRQQAKVVQGAHTIQTILHSANSGYQITGWETDYTIYERKVRGAD
jgi:hypothetical protein